VLRGDVAEQVGRLKQLPGRELQIHGSGRLAQSMLAAGLIDELRLVVTPTVIGQGRRLFPADGPSIGMRVTSHSITPGGLAITVLETTGAPSLGSYEGVAALDG
jgi:dihydrofolate reductase